MKLPKKRWWILAILVLALIVYIVYASVHEELPKVQTDRVITKDLVQRVSASGKVQPVDQVDISAYVSAEVTKLYVEEGQEVTKGQLLVELDSTRYRANRDQALAGLYGARAQQRLTQAQLVQSENILNRTKELFKKQLVGEQELETAETSYKVNLASSEASKDGIRQAQAALRLARDDLAKTTLVAPIDGKISRLEKEVGEIVMGSQLTRDIIMTVADLARMEVVVEVDENDVVDVQMDDAAQIEVDALPKTKFSGKVTEIAISPKIQGLGTLEETTNFEVSVQILDDVSKLRPGMSATADIDVESRQQVLTLPIQCLTMRDVEAARNASEGGQVSQFRQGGKDALKEVVFKFDGTSLTMTEVQTGISSDTEIEIVTGLQEGDEIVCGPYKTVNKILRDGQKVQVAPPEESKGKP